MSARLAELPRGYVTVRAREGTAVVLEREARGVLELLGERKLYAWAASMPSATRYEGRLPAYGLPLPYSETRVVVRHATHGGMFAALTGDRFLAPGRAPYELRVAQALEGASVMTPRVVGFALYDAGPLLCRSDVMTSEITGARDLVSALGAASSDSRMILEATARLLVALARAGAHHADLNLKNVLVVSGDSGPVAFVLDVDRVSLGVDPREAMRRNLARLERSALKWSERRAIPVTELDLQWLAGRARELAT